MAATFASASSQKLLASLIPSYPCSVATWFNVTSVATTQIFWRTDSPNLVALDLLNTGALRAYVGSNVATTSTTATANVWHHACGVFANATSRAVYLDGGGKGTNATSATLASITQTAIGATTSSTNFLNGSLAFLGFWQGVALSDAEVVILASNFASPRLVHPEFLASYPRFSPGSASPMPDFVFTSTWAVSNGPLTDAANPTIYFP